MSSMLHPVSMYHGSVSDNINGLLLENPAFVLNRSLGCIVHWGEYANVEKKYDVAVAKYRAVGLYDMADELTLVKMDGDLLSREEQCYVLKRLLEFTATDFGLELAARLGDQDITKWLREQMRLLPLNLDET